MSLLSPITDDRVGDSARPLFDAINHTFGSIPNVYRTMGHSPEVLNAVLRLSKAIRKDLPPKLRELAYLKVSIVNNCDYSISYHTDAARRVGVSNEQIEAIRMYQESDLFTPEEKTVISFSEQMTRFCRVDNITMNELKALLSPSQLVVLSATVGLANLNNRFVEAFEVQLP